LIFEIKQSKMEKKLCHCHFWIFWVEFDLFISFSQNIWNLIHSSFIYSDSL
jgi:hypothetical protein